MLNTLIVLLAVVLMSGLLYFEREEEGRIRALNKGALSLLFIAAAAVQKPSVPPYYLLLLAGLIFCLGGDVFLALPRKEMFFYGLISFLLGHVFYIFGFFYLSGVSGWTWIGAAAGVLTSGAVYLHLRSHLHEMKKPVLLYIFVITAMVTGAWSVLGEPTLQRPGRIMIFTGALAFYLSDLFVARDRFLKKAFLNRLVGLPMYYAGQFLLAFSVGVLK